MALPIHSHYYKFSTPCIDFTISKTALEVTQYLMVTFFIASCAVALSGVSKQYSWSYGLNLGVIVVSLLILGITCCFQKQDLSEKKSLVNRVLSSHTTPLVSELSEEHMGLMHELCEMDGEGQPKECTLERVNTILSKLKEEDSLSVLNSIPSYYMEESRNFLCYTRPIQYTPLHYWASKGNLEVVKLLVGHGACDYCANSPSYTTSALYEAGLHGHIEVVQYLLNYGAHADLPFNNNSLFYFIPQLMFQMLLEPMVKYQGCLECLDLILTSLSESDPSSLQLQLKIPVDEDGANILCWIKKNDTSSLAQDLVRMLVKWGANETAGCTLDELTQKGMHTGNGITLVGLASLK